MYVGGTVEKKKNKKNTNQQRRYNTMATQSVNNALETFYHHHHHHQQQQQQQRQEHLQQNQLKQRKQKQNRDITTDQDKQENMRWMRRRTLKTTIQSRKWKKTRNILDHFIFPFNSTMLTKMILIIVLVSKSTVDAAQRDSSIKSKEGNSLNAISGYGVATPANPIITNGTVTIATDNTATSSTPVTQTNVVISSSSSTIITTTSNRNKGSSSGVNRNTIEVNEENRNGPYFDKGASKNITALLGKTAYLNCRVKNLGNKTMLLQVSWVRHRDIHLLTVGRYTYTSDQRFRAIHQPQTEDWILQIKYPQHRDSGIYECQVSTTPHMSHYIHLNVVEPSTEIIGAPDLYIESGSTINLTCVILNSPEPPAYIFWNHNSAIINYDSPRGGVSVVTNKGETTTSFLLIKTARPSDSGQYQCNPSNSKSKGVTVHVLNGVSHSVSRGIPSSNAARGTSTSSNVSKSLSISFPINIFICYSIYQTVSENSECCYPHLTQTINIILKAIIFCITALIIKCLKIFSKYTHRTTMIIEFQSLQQYSNHDRFKNTSLEFKSHAYPYKLHHHQNQHHQYHHHHHHHHHHHFDPNHNQLSKPESKLESTSNHPNSLNQISITTTINDNHIKMQRLNETLQSNTNDLLSESTRTLSIKFRKKIYTQESDVR